MIHPPFSPVPKPARRHSKHESIVRRLRADILNSKLIAGSKLPPHPVLARHFGVSLATLQTALGQLTREGFVTARARQGTFVNPKLPHLTNYALVFWNDPRALSQWTKYYAALASAAAEIERTQGRQITFFYGIDHHVDTEDRQRLLDLMQGNRLAGMIFANNPAGLAGSPLLDEPGIPRVAIMGQKSLPHVPALAFGGDRLLTRALDYLIAQGRSRVAVVSIEMDEAHDGELARVLASRGLATPDYWRQCVSRLDTFGARHCVQLLLRGPAADRPNGLIITDDNLVEHALAGVVAAGVNVPADLEVVAHCNFPWPTASVLPVKRLGVDMSEALCRGIEIIDRQRRGEAVPDVTTIPAVFEEELTKPEMSDRPVTTRPLEGVLV